MLIVLQQLSTINQTLLIRWYTGLLLKGKFRSQYRILALKVKNIFSALYCWRNLACWRLLLEKQDPLQSLVKSLMSKKCYATKSSNRNGLQGGILQSHNLLTDLGAKGQSPSFAETIQTKVLATRCDVLSIRPLDCSNPGGITAAFTVGYTRGENYQERRMDDSWNSKEAKYGLWSRSGDDYIFCSSLSNEADNLQQAERLQV